MPIKEAVKIYKDQLKSSLDSLTKKKSDFQEKEQQQKEKISGVREQSHSLQSHVTSQFAELRQIITEKEQSLLRDLREEEKRILNPMEKNLLALQENIRSIQEEISKLKEQMDQKDSVIFLKEEARRNKRINDDVQELAVTDEAQRFEKFDHPYLLNTVLRETLDAINRASDVPEELQKELIEIQCNWALKYKFETVSLDSFYQYLGPMYPKMTDFASKILCIIGTRYLCEQAFSIMNINKSKLRSQLTHKHLNDIMKIGTAQKLVPDVDRLVKTNRCQVSGSSK
ncbi:uncharacterized protein [Hemitrygon akajei]|uniref:uncharacterized protein n=1 Tax=Hemitrygon akajei TaxID=2704970 RepID=UPI003BF9C674